jgi:hypothetical protein
MAKKVSREDLAFPVTTIPRLGALEKPKENPTVIKMIIRGSIQGAYGLKTPSEPNKWSDDYGKKQQPVVSEDQIQFVINLIESLQPADAIEAALASQFAITYIRGLECSPSGYIAAINLFEFGHQVLEALTKYRTKGAQLINVQYNHNQGQINNIKVVKEETTQEIIEVC